MDEYELIQHQLTKWSHPEVQNKSNPNPLTHNSQVIIHISGTLIFSLLCGTVDVSWLFSIILFFSVTTQSQLLSGMWTVCKLHHFMGGAAHHSIAVTWGTQIPPPRSLIRGFCCLLLCCYMVLVFRWHLVSRSSISKIFLLQASHHSFSAVWPCFMSSHWPELIRELLTSWGSS